MSLRTALPATGLALLLAACSSIQPDPGAPGRAGAAAGAVGQPADEAVMARVWRESGAGLIRPIAPGQAVTRDFRADRVNVHIDRDNRISAVSCG